MPAGSTWMALVSCPPMSSTVAVPGYITCAPRPWQRISLRMCSLLKGSRARSRCRRRRSPPCRCRAPGSARPPHRAGLRLGQRGEGALQRRHQVTAHRVGVDAVLDLDDRAVEQVEQVVVAHAQRLGYLLADGQVLAAGDVAEEVALAPRAGAEQRRRLDSQALEDLVERLGHRALLKLECAQVAAAGGLQGRRAARVLLGAEVAFELADEALQRTVERAAAAARRGTGGSGR